MIGTASTRVTIEGIDELIDVLRQLPPNVSAKLIRPAMHEAGKALASRARYYAYRVLQAAEGRGYKRRNGAHLFTTAATRARTYRKGEVTYVAVGFNYRTGGSHAHLVELGHRIVHGGTLGKGMTAAGKRYLRQMGWGFGKYTDGVVLHGKRKGKPRVVRGGMLSPSGKIVVPGEYVNKTRIRGGGVVLRRKEGGAMRTREFPMLRPAFNDMKRPMLITIENELRKIEGEAMRLAKNPQKRQWLDNPVI